MPDDETYSFFVTRARARTPGDVLNAAQAAGYDLAGHLRTVRHGDGWSAVFRKPAATPAEPAVGPTP